MRYEDILFEVGDGRATVTINRPERLNAFRARTILELCDAFERAGDDEAVGVIVSTGAGDRAFSAGNDLKHQADIVTVIQDYVSLKKTGATYKGLCPFHGEKTPSFHVNRDKGFFHCFGCGVGGDVFKFLELHEKVGFADAIKLLAQRFGVALPELEQNDDQRAPKDKDTMKESFAAAKLSAEIEVYEGAHGWCPPDTQVYNEPADYDGVVGFIDREPRLLRPNNYPKLTPGSGSVVAQTRSGKRVLVIQVMGRLFMEPLDDPFASVESALGNHRVGTSVDAIVIDIHAEATSEKTAMGVYLDGRVSMVVGSHSHIPTADARILPGGTAYQTDAGMCGDYNSVIGMKKDAAVARFIKKMPGDRLAPAEGEGTLCGAIVETDDKTGLAKSIRPLRLGGRLPPTG